jgi:hypothetical protein
MLVEVVEIDLGIARAIGSGVLVSGIMYSSQVAV